METLRVCKVCTFLNHPLLPTCEICECKLDCDEIDIGDDKACLSAKSDLKNIDKNGVPQEMSSSSKSQKFNSGSATSGLIASLREKMLRRKSTAFAICSDCPHISQRGYEGERWSCGYRNIQMICLSLSADHSVKRRIFNGNGDVPDIHGLQSWIEKAWAAGFDSIGSQQLGNSLLGTRKWIGSTECVALLRYFGLRAFCVDFENTSPKPSTISSNTPLSANSVSERKCNGETRNNKVGGKRKLDCISKDRCPLSVTSYFPPTVSSASAPSSTSSSESYSLLSLSSQIIEFPSDSLGERIGKWVRKYFAHDRLMPPLYFQHQGHSRTIIGYELMKSDLALLIFDPSTSGKVLQRNLECDGRWQQQVRQNVRTLNKAAYQIVFVMPGIISEMEREKSKIISPILDTDDLSSLSI